MAVLPAQTSLLPRKRRFSDAPAEAPVEALPAMAAFNSRYPREMGGRTTPIFAIRGAGPLQHAESAVVSEKSRIPCIHFKRPRGCNKGDACEYKHEGVRDTRDYIRYR